MLTEAKALEIINSLTVALVEVGRRWQEAEVEVVELEKVADALRKRLGEEVPF